ncbi:mRNA interferase YafQ [hydrothermal vent metagenome]|uniref:mRNA interferase YafQ n=1 Tax=hydrothermal vent metagenome TaxID=652676 RepID=A0A3B0VG68_9ZZZZ
MRTVRYSSRFKKDLKRVKRRGADVNILQIVIKKLAHDEVLDAKYSDHALIGNYAGTRECHLKPDWLLIYRLVNDQLILVRTGSHADLF